MSLPRTRTSWTDSLLGAGMVMTSLGSTGSRVERLSPPHDGGRNVDVNEGKERTDHADDEGSCFCVLGEQAHRRDRRLAQAKRPWRERGVRPSAGPWLRGVRGQPERRRGRG